MDEIKDKGKLLHIANLAEQAERYDDMMKLMKSIVFMSKGLEEEERNLLSVAYKNAIGARRSAWRIIHSLEDKEIANGNTKMSELAARRREDIEKEIKDISAGLLELLDKYLIAYAETDETKVFFYKMKGDYYRYVVEVTTGDERKELASEAQKAYEAAKKTTPNLPSTHPIRLGLALNLSVFHYEIMNDGKKACELAKAAFDSAVNELDSISESQYKETTQIMALLRDNFTLWTSENEDDENDG